VKVFSEVVGFLQRMDEEINDMNKLRAKQMHLKRLMQLKIKGRFLEETQIFEQELQQVPTVNSQKKVVRKK
jgi:hypothetical protein